MVFLNYKAVRFQTSLLEHSMCRKMISMHKVVGADRNQDIGKENCTGFISRIGRYAEVRKVGCTDLARHFIS